MTGAMFIAHCLKQEGVTKVFGQCGHTNYALIDACHRLGIEYISFRHEQQAAHAADAYYRVTAQAGGAERAPVAGADQRAHRAWPRAAADSTPMVVITGNTPSYHHAREPHQGIRLHADASQGDIYPADLQARVARRRRQVPGRRDAARAQPGADRAAGRGAARRADGRLLAAHRRAGARDVVAAGRTTTRPGAAADGIADAVRLLQSAHGTGDLRRQRRAARRSRRRS